MKSPLSFKPVELVDYHKNRLEFMKQDLRRKVLSGQMKDTFATKLIAMQEYTLQLIQEKQPVRQMKLGESKS